MIVANDWVLTFPILTVAMPAFCLNSCLRTTGLRCANCARTICFR